MATGVGAYAPYTHPLVFVTAVSHMRVFVSLCRSTRSRERWSRGRWPRWPFTSMFACARARAHSHAHPVQDVQGPGTAGKKRSQGPLYHVHA